MGRPIAQTRESRLDGGQVKPNINGTLAALAGIALTAVLAGGTLPSDLARSAAIGVLLSLGMSVYADFRIGGMRNLIRADLMAILAYYFLTLFEFLFPQPNFDSMIDLHYTHEGLIVVLIGFCGLLIGRHLVRPALQPFSGILTRELPAGWMLFLLCTCFIVGFLHMLIAVEFDVGEMIHYFMEPRFSQPWQRGRFGDWKALLVELGMLIYLIPPLAGIMIARRRRYSTVAILFVGAALLFTFFYSFTSGTRNIFCAHLLTFLIGYGFAIPLARQKELLILSAVAALLMLGATYFMLQFRNVGFRNYVLGEYEPPQRIERTLFVDYNLYTVCRLVEVFPDKKDYLGFEIPYQALIRPIPRAIWKGKPEGLTSSIEDALGAEGMTIAASFAGEAYMAGGLAAVLTIGLCFGAVTGWWNYFASPNNSELGNLIYASGFFASIISMRSMLVFTTAMLPTLTALVVGTYAVKVMASQARRILSRVTARPKPMPRPVRSEVPRTQRPAK